MGGENDLLRAIELMKTGDLQPAVALLQQAVDDTDLDEHGRAVACIWLAETQDDVGFKIGCLRQALRHEPGNPQIQQELDQLHSTMMERHSGTWEPTSAPNGVRLARAPLVLGIAGGANGRGSGIFINREGLVATTATVVGSALAVSIGCGNAQAVPGQVIRRYPESDLALIQTPVSLETLEALERLPAVIASETVTRLGS